MRIKSTPKSLIIGLLFSKQKTKALKSTFFVRKKSQIPYFNIKSITPPLFFPNNTHLKIIPF